MVLLKDERCLKKIVIPVSSLRMVSVSCISTAQLEFPRCNEGVQGVDYVLKGLTKLLYASTGFISLVE